MANEKSERYIKIGDDGTLLPASATEWQAVLDTRTNLMWSVEVLERQNFKKAKASVAKLDTAGFKDWRLPTVEELFCLADRARFDPAIDTDFFPETPSAFFWSSTLDASWYWTATPYAASPSGFAWVVGFGNGGSDWFNQGSECHVRAVRAGQ